MTVPYIPTGPDAPPENVQRGVAFAVIALPLGIIAWDLLWSVGFIASIVALGVAYLALRLYRVGSGGPIGRPGAIAVTVVTIVTLVLAFISGFAFDMVGLYSSQHGTSVPETLVTPGFWASVFASMASGQNAISFLLAGVFGLLGCFGILRTAFRQTRPQSAGSVLPGARLMYPPQQDAPPVPPAPPAGPTLNGEPLDPDKR